MCRVRVVLSRDLRGEIGGQKRSEGDVLLYGKMETRLPAKPATSFPLKNFRVQFMVHGSQLRQRNQRDELKAFTVNQLVNICNQSKMLPKKF
jgi:hypothetical protein